VIKLLTEKYNRCLEKHIELNAEKTLNCKDDGDELSRERRDNGVQDNA